MPEADGPPGRHVRTLAVTVGEIDEQWDIDEKLGALWRSARLGPTVERLRRTILQAGERAIEPGQFRALDTVAAHGPAAIGEIATVMGLEPSSVTRATAKLEAAGLIRKQRAERDHREVLVELTDEGLEVHQYFVDRAFALYQQIFVVFSLEERLVLADLLERMLKSSDVVLAEVAGVDHSEVDHEEDES
jgi:DNA-binding MarR family transcriptional regulator